MSGIIETLERGNQDFQALTPAEQTASRFLLSDLITEISRNPSTELNQDERNGLILNLFAMHVSGDFGSAAREIVLKNPSFNPHFHLVV